MHKHEEQRFVFYCWYKLSCLVRSLIPRCHHWEVTSYLCCTFWQALSVPHTSPSVWSLHLLGCSVEILTHSYLLVLYLYANINSYILIFQFVLWLSYTIFCSTLLMSGHRNIWYISYCRTETFISSTFIHVLREFCVCLLLLVLPQFWVFSQQNKEKYDLIVWFLYSFIAVSDSTHTKNKLFN